MSSASDSPASSQESESGRRSLLNPSTSSISQGVDEETLPAITYGLYSLAAMIPPVTLAMLLSTLCTLYISTPSHSAQTRSAFASTYQVYDTSDDTEQSNAALLSQSIINALVIIVAIAVMTFVIVGLFYFNCLRCLQTYMTVSSFLLLSVMGGSMWSVAIEKYEWNVDYFTYIFTMYNFAILGVFSITTSTPTLRPASFPRIYAILTSTLLSWQLQNFDARTGWALLVFLGFYDLCAVLTPCGPLKALVGLMKAREERGEGGQALPGLLYEADLPVARGTRRDSDENGTQLTESPPPPPPPDVETPPSTSSPAASTDVAAPGPTPPLFLPFSLARELSLTIVTNTPPSFPGDKVECIRPGGYKYAFTPPDTYHVREEDSMEVRSFIISPDGSCEELAFGEEDEDEGGTIKLGLGDFIFYSVLVGKAATFSALTAILAASTILAGLAATLALLSIYKMALPALPISIFLGVIVYFIAKVMVQPWVEDVIQEGIYV